MDQQKIIVNVVHEHAEPLLMSEEAIQKCSQLILSKELKAGSYTLSVINCTDSMIRELNNQYRGVDQPTDVLTFTLNDEGLDEPTELGDIFLSIDTIKRQSSYWNNTPEQEYLFMIIHGLLHICGYEHEGPYNEEEEMFKRQKLYYELFVDKIKPI